MDWQLTCRVCLESGDMVSLFDWDENNEQLGDKYTYCCGVEVTKNDSLPTLICLNCVDRLTYAYQFKQQCLASNDTLKECLQEFLKTSAAVSASRAEKAGTETITIKQENGLLLQYELPVEHDPQAQWTRTLMKTPSSAVVAKAPGPRKRGRPRKYPNEQGAIDVSPYQRKKPKTPQKEQKALTTLLASGSVLKEEPGEDDPYEAEGYDDPDFDPGAEDVESEPEVKKEPVTPKKRGRPRKNVMQQLEPKPKEDPAEDVLLKETIMAFSEPIPEHILNPKPKKKKKPPQQRKKYIYEKTHICETCGASFTSNASLQAHIRRHLGIKPFVCSVCGYACVLNMELRRHMMRHTGVRPYKCRVCDRRFGDFGSRQKHERVCGYSCVLKEALKRHMFKHTGEKPYKCRICDRRYGDYGTRQKHERLHMGLRPYQCSLCGKAFTYSYVLANHMLTHTGEKKYSCAPCNKKFTKAHHLKYHNKVHHKEVYQQQQLEQQARKIRQQLNVNNLSDVIAGQLVDGTLQLVHANEEGSKKNRFTNKKRLYSRDAIGKAITAVHKQGISVREAAKKYGVPRSTIQFKIKNPTSKLTSGPGPILTNTEEDALCAFILNLAKRGIPCKKEVIQLCVQSYLKKNPRPNPFTDDKPGDVWFKAFLKRHPIITTLEGLNNTSVRVSEDDKRIWLQEFEEYFNEEGSTEDVEDVERKYIEEASADETDGEQDTDQMQVVEDEEGDSDNKETDRAIAGMEGVVLDAEFSMDDDEKSQ